MDNMDIENAINSIYKEYKKLEPQDRITYFTKRAPWEKIGVFSKLDLDMQIELINNLNPNDKKELLEQLSPNQIKELYVNLNDKQSKISFLEQLSDKQIKDLYENVYFKSLQEELSQLLQELHINLEERKDNLAEEINTSYNTITDSSNSIIRSNQNIANHRAQISEQKDQLKYLNKQIKQIEKERAKKLRRQLKASKPSKLDRIAIISKYRAKKLAQRTAELNQTISELNTKVATRDNVEIKIDDLTTKIEQERANVEAMQQRIQEEKERISANTKAISNTNARIKQLSKSEKSILGKKLHNQRLSEINKVMVTKKRERRVSAANSEQATKEPPEVEIIQTQENDVSAQRIQSQENMTKAVQNLLNLFGTLQESGVSFLPNAVPITDEQNENLANNNISIISNQLQQVAIYVTGLIAMQLYQKYQEQSVAQEQIQGITRTLRAPGFVNLPLLLSIILFIFSLVLFFIK